jgi:hypothetical protein
MSSKLGGSAMLPAIVLLLVSCCGCQWFQRRPQLEPTPILFQQAPNLEQLLTAVNRNSDAIDSMRASDARMTVRGVPTPINVDLAYERPRRLRLRAATGFTGQVLDLGSNEELFWFWTSMSQQPALFFARHDQFALSPNRSLIPVEPLWIIDAMGLPHFEPTHRHDGPYPKGNGLVEVRSRIPTAEGESTKLTLLHQQYAWVMQQQVFDPRGRLIASAQATDHEYFPHAAAALPRKVAIELPAAQLSFAVETQGYSVNLSSGDGSEFALPQEQFPNVPLVDLADPRINAQAATPTPPAYVPPSYPSANQQPRRRGYR